MCCGTRSHRIYRATKQKKSSADEILRRRRVSHPSSLPQVSVIIPVYATAEYVGEALDSVLSQTFDDYEIIVVNDGSPDSDLLDMVLRPYLNKINYIVQENRGSSGARNTALKAARGRYVAMLDSDDRWHPEYLASQLSLIEADPSIDVVYPRCRLFTLDGAEGTLPPRKRRPGREISFLRVLTREVQIYGGATARRETLVRAGMYDEDLESGEDFELWLRVLKAGGRIVHNDRVLAYYRQRPGSHTSDELRLTKNVLLSLDKVATQMDLTAEERATLVHQRAGVIAKLSLLEGKMALIAGDPATAMAKLAVVARHKRSWKLRSAIVALKLVPSALLYGYRLRTKWDSWRVQSRNGSKSK